MKLLIVVSVLLWTRMIGAWITPRATSSLGTMQLHRLSQTKKRQENPLWESTRNGPRTSSSSITLAAAASTAAVDTNKPPPPFSNRKNFSEQDMVIVKDLYHSIKDLLPLSEEPDAWQNILLKALPTMPTSLLVKLRTAAVPLSSSSSSVLQGPPDQDNDEDEIAIFRVAMAIEHVLQARMMLAKETLESLLDAGEIRKLDARIGNVARAGRLDAAFFNVLTMNLQDAAKEESSSSSSKNTHETNDTKATRLQILQHIYTRCQEEVEKSLSPGTALLNKLMRTPQASIRANLYRHYLTPQPTTITSPDGKTITLPNNNNNATLVDLTDFIQAIDETVLQIRNIEHVGGTDRESAAMMVESCRQIAKEARKILGMCYGRESDPIKQFEDALQPVFRPTSPDSPYIQGDIQ